jgi:competence protein ComEC
VRVLSFGNRLRAGEVEIEVLHPPAAGPDGNENSRSMVLLIRHAGHSILLTGDLEGPGLEQVTMFTAPPVDVLMAPHHGNKVATAAMVHWAKPRVLLSCQGPPRSALKTEPENAAVPSLLGTWPHGAVTVHSRADSLVLETFVSKQRWKLLP